MFSTTLLPQVYHQISGLDFPINTCDCFKLIITQIITLTGLNLRRLPVKVPCEWIVQPEASRLQGGWLYKQEYFVHETI